MNYSVEDEEKKRLNQPNHLLDFHYLYKAEQT